MRGHDNHGRALWPRFVGQRYAIATEEGSQTRPTSDGEAREEPQATPGDRTKIPSHKDHTHGRS